MESITSQKIADFLGFKLHGTDLTITQVSSISNIATESLVFANKYSQELANTLNNHCGQVLALVVPEYEYELRCSHILVSNPRLEFARILNRFFAEKPSETVAKTAIIGDDVFLGSGVTIGEYAVIGKNVKIGDNTEIRNHVVVGDNTSIGSRCLIKSHAVIGEEGFGFDFQADGIPIRVPHIGCVEIGNNVEIGAFSTVAKATLEKTIIGNHVKIDDHVHVAHNVVIGEKTLLTACAIVAGSVTIGEGVWIAPNASITNKVSVGNRSFVGIGTVVNKDVPENSIVVGNPARRTGHRYEEGD